jgi:hypothetical protein
MSSFAQPGSVPVPADVITYARKALWSLEASVTVTREEILYRGRGAEVSLPGGARFGVAVDPTGVSLSCDPGLHVRVRFAPDVRIDRLRYDFATGVFHVGAEGDRRDLFGLVGSLTANKIEFRLHERFGPLLPERMRKPGYSPAADERLLDTLSELVRVLRGSVEPELATSQLGDMAPTLAQDLFLYLHAVAPETLQVTLPGVGLEVYCSLGTSLFVSVQTERSLDRPRIRSLKLRTPPRGVVIRTPPGSAGSSMLLDLQELNASPGGRIAFGYQLGIEDIVALPPPLRSYLGLDNVDFRLSGAQGLVRTVRRAIDRSLAEGAPALLQLLVRRFDPMLPGADLAQLLGIDIDDEGDASGRG